ncbi:LysR substrate-binding domain-containing protein [Mesorhizobium sp. M1340]|uniref:LysR substrate-binding domain-containing protein n=1 Tax=unclassified Mesorhizobium TaxID=325217 RepID=UPI0033362DA6
MSLTEGSYPEFGVGLGSAEVDITVTFSFRSTGGAFELRLWNDALAVVLASNHPLASNSVIGWADLGQETLLVRRGEAFLLGDAVGCDVPLPTIVEHHVSAGVLLRLVGNALGVALIHDGDVNNLPEGPSAGSCGSG